MQTFPSLYPKNGVHLPIFRFDSIWNLVYLIKTDSTKFAFSNEKRLYLGEFNKVLVGQIFPRKGKFKVSLMGD